MLLCVGCVCRFISRVSVYLQNLLCIGQERGCPSPERGILYDVITCSPVMGKFNCVLTNSEDKIELN